MKMMLWAICASRVLPRRFALSAFLHSGEGAGPPYSLEESETVM